MGQMAVLHCGTSFGWHILPANQRETASFHQLHQELSVSSRIIPYHQGIEFMGALHDLVQNVAAIQHRISANLILLRAATQRLGVRTQR
jgi:hypothetical protein